MSAVLTCILLDIFDGWALESQLLQRADTVICNWISCASAAFRIVIQFHLLLICKEPCYSAVIFGFAVEVSVIAKNLNAFCIKVMYILIYSETNETYIYIIVKSQEFKNVIGLVILFIVKAVALHIILNYFMCVDF